MNYIIKGQISKYRNGHYLCDELDNLGWVLVKENSHPKGWSLARKRNISFVKHWSPNLKNLDSYITRHIHEIKGDK